MLDTIPVPSKFSLDHGMDQQETTFWPVMIMISTAILVFIGAIFCCWPPQCTKITKTISRLARLPRIGNYENDQCFHHVEVVLVE